MNCFPALFAPASLKPVTLRVLQDEPQGFPALFAPASLKQLQGNSN